MTVAMLLANPNLTSKSQSNERTVRDMLQGSPPPSAKKRMQELDIDIPAVRSAAV